MNAMNHHEPTTATRQFFGKFRAQCIQNFDPKQMGRIQVMVPDISPIPLATWAMPCVPFAGEGTGFFAVPVIGAGVWVEFEQGDPDYPIWTGCYWGRSSETPKGAKLSPPPIPAATIETATGNMFHISDTPGIGGITLKTRTGAQIVMNDLGITITNGQGATITMIGNTIDFNNGALTIM